MAGDDIVTRLRDYHATVSEAPPYYRELTQAAADEIERLREELTASHESHGNEVGALTERLSLAIHERDEARREVCGLDADLMEDQRDYARQRGWDCFDLTPNDIEAHEVRGDVAGSEGAD